MTHLKIGDKAPEFKGINEKNEEISLKDFKGKKVVLYFYPKDLTPGCTAQACNLSENYTFLKKSGYEVLGVSADDVKKHQKFIEKYKLPFQLLADVDKKIIEQYGVWGPKKFMGREFNGIHRTTFIINGEGFIEEIIQKVDTKNHTKQILE